MDLKKGKGRVLIAIKQMYFKTFILSTDKKQDKKKTNHVSLWIMSCN